jgi:hypothetical protein
MNRRTKKLLEVTSTPLASIFGSGFLVIVPILAGAVGPYSVYAMAAVCALAYSVGWVIRFNILHAEPVLASQPPETTLALERSSDLALILAYIISVSLYLHILSAFVLAGIGVDSALNENLLTTTIIAFIMITGVVKGLESLQILEQWALYLTLAIIVILILGFGWYDWQAWQSSAGITLPAATERSAWTVLTVVAGTLIVVQGFETTRYLGGSFDSAIRIQASRLSQLVSTGVYLVFVALALPVATALNGQYNDDSLIKLTGIVAGILVAPLIVAAALSQFSAAVADTMAATGNMEETTHKQLKARFGYIIVGSGAIALTWSADTYEILALASRAFAFYYLLQCLVGISVSHSFGQRFRMAVIAAMLGFITVFAVPAS